MMVSRASCHASAPHVHRWNYPIPSGKTPLRTRSVFARRAHHFQPNQNHEHERTHPPRRAYGRAHPAVMGQVLGIVYRAIASHLIKAAGYHHETAQTGAVTLVQRFGSAFNLLKQA